MADDVTHRAHERRGRRGSFVASAPAAVGAASILAIDEPRYSAHT
jgi:hypothetical protein